MSDNVGALDRVIRICIGLGLVTWLLVAQGPSRWWGLIGVVLVWSAWVGFCTLYRLLGLKTSGKERDTSYSH